LRYMEEVPALIPCLGVSVVISEVEPPFIGKHVILRYLL